MHPDLTSEQKELLEVWDELDAEEHRILLNFVRPVEKQMSNHLFSTVVLSFLKLGKVVTI